MIKSIEHAYRNLYIDVADDGASLRFGPDTREEDIPCDGEFIRVGGQIYQVGTMDTSDPPLLERVDYTVSPSEIWWDADDPSCVAS